MNTEHVILQILPSKDVKSTRLEGNQPESKCFCNHRNNNYIGFFTREDRFNMTTYRLLKCVPVIELRESDVGGKFTKQLKCSSDGCFQNKASKHLRVF